MSADRTAEQPGLARSGGRPPPESGSAGRKATDWDAVLSIKGGIVAAVLANHYLVRYVSVDWAGIANALVAGFFIFSGYGIHGALRRSWPAEGPTAAATCRFLRDRILRIFPLYWVALGLQNTMSGEPGSWTAYLAIRGPHQFWFVSAILQCYLFAPLIYRALNRASPRRFTGVLLAALFALNAPLQILHASRPDLALALLGPPAGYRRVFLCHVALFAAGMGIRHHLSGAAAGRTVGFVRWRAPVLAAFAVVFLAAWKWLDAAHGPLGKALRLSVDGAFLAAYVVFCACAVRRPFRVPALAWAGRYAYSIYLFHLSYFALLEGSGLLRPGAGARGAAFALLGLALFLPACRTIEGAAEHYLRGRSPDRRGDIAPTPDGRQKGRVEIIPDREREMAMLLDVIQARAAAWGRLRILEAGCGRAGHLLLAGIPHTLTGVDLDERALRARQTDRGDLDAAIHGDLRDVTLPPGTFDVIYSAFVLEHVEGAARVLANFARWVRPGGLILLRIPDRDSAYGFLTRFTPFWVHVAFKWLVRGSRNARVPGLGPYPTVYDPAISRAGIRSFCDQYGLSILRECGADYALRRPGAAAGFIRLAIRLLGVLSGGRLATRHANLTYVLEKRPE
jgi:peptidoglycan/LPS O-acetylase OafA/YrhL